MAQKAQHPPLLGFVPLGADHDAVAVAVGARARHHRRHDRRVQAPQPFEQVPELSVLEAQLFRVVQVLVLAAAARPEIPAMRFDPVGRGPHHPHQPGAGKIFPHLDHLDFDLLVRGHKRHKDHEPRHARHALAAQEQILAACPALARLLQMDIVSSSEHDDFMRHLAAIAGELQLLIASCGG